MNKKLMFIFFSFVLSFSVSSQSSEVAYTEKVKTLDSTLETLYGVISGDAGEARDWDLFRFLFKPDARLIPIQNNSEGPIGANYMSADDYVERAGTWLETNGFFEKEIHRKEDTFGQMTQVFSTYESYRSSKDTEPFARGINSIQLLNDGQRWWIINIYWFAESEEFPIPAKYLP